MRKSAGEYRVAILVACFNDGATIRQTIESLLGERDSELVVVDDGSTEPATLEQLVQLEHDGVRVLRQENSGPAAAWMAGLRATTAPYVIPFSSDDILVRGATSSLADALDSNLDAAVAWGDMRSFGRTNADIPSAPALCPWHVTYVNSRNACALFRRSELLGAGGWQLRTGIEDWDLWMRFAALRLGGVHVPRTTLYYRRDAGGRFQNRVPIFELFYEELRERNAVLFASRAATRRESPAPTTLKLLLPFVDRLPFISRLTKVQVCDALTLLFWSAGLRKTTVIVGQGILWRLYAALGRA